MPLPTPNEDEGHDEFMDRCMGNDTMVEEYPDDDQRYAVCQAQWDKEGDSERAADPPKDEMERRILCPEAVELRIAPDKEGKSHLVGYAARFNRESLDLGGFVERIKPGAFTEALKNSDVRALKNHDPNLLLGRASAKTLALTENSRGLKFDVKLPDTTVGRDTATEVDRGDITGCSFSFMVAEDEWTEDKDGRQVRTIVSVRELFDVGPVTFPAYPDTTVAARHLAAISKGFETSESIREQEDERAKRQVEGSAPTPETQHCPGIDEADAEATRASLEELGTVSDEEVREEQPTLAQCDAWRVQYEEAEHEKLKKKALRRIGA